MQQRKREVLEMALVGLTKLQTQVQQELAGLRGEQPKRRKMSVAGRRRIAEAQRKRWRQYHKERASAH